MRLTERARKRLGVRAALVVEDGASNYSGRGRDYFLPDHRVSSIGVIRTLNRVLGRASTVDRGEVAYWTIPSDWVAEDD